MIDFDDEDMEIIHAARLSSYFLTEANIPMTDIRWSLRVRDHVLRKWAACGWKPNRLCGLRVVRMVQVTQIVEMEEGEVRAQRRVK